MTKKELKIIKEEYNKVWQELLNREISLLEDNKPLEFDEYRMNLIYAQTYISDLIKALGLNSLELVTEETENLIEKSYGLKYRETV